MVIVTPLEPLQILESNPPEEGQAQVDIQQRIADFMSYFYIAIAALIALSDIILGMLFCYRSRKL